MNHIRKHLPREVAIMLLPCFALLALGLMMQSRNPQLPALVFESAQVTSIPPANGKRHYKGESDTRVTVIVKYNPPTLEKQLISGPNWKPFSGKPMYLEDEKGKKYQFFNTLYKGQKKGMTVGFLTNLDNHRYSIAWQFPLSQVPSTAGKVTFKTRIQVDQAKDLPASVVVRPSKG